MKRELKVFPWAVEDLQPPSVAELKTMKRELKAYLQYFGLHVLKLVAELKTMKRELKVVATFARGGASIFSCSVKNDDAWTERHKLQKTTEGGEEMELQS